MEGRAQIVLPATAPPAFHKAAHYLGMDVVHVPVDAAYRADPAATAAALTPRTALVVVSAPSYPQGVMDPVPEIAALAVPAGVPCHVDACVGGWVLPWPRDAGVASIPGLRVLGEPVAPLVAVASSDPALDVFVLAELLASVGVDLAGGAEPEMAVVNTILDRLPPATREALLIRFLPALYA